MCYCSLYVKTEDFCQKYELYSAAFSAESTAVTGNRVSSNTIEYGNREDETMSGKHKAYRRVICGCMITLFVVMLTSCSTVRRTKIAGNQVASPAVDTRTITGVVIQNDIEAKQLQLRELDSDVISTLTYGASSVIQDQYQEEREGEEIEVGLILQVSYRSSDAKLVSALVPDDVWEYQEVKRFTFSGDENMLQVAGGKYQYSSTTYFAADGATVEPMELNNQDVLTVRGIGIYVYSVVRTSGHGYIRLTNYQDFIGGMAEVSSDLMVPISENMLITAAEGTYRLTLCKGRTAATKTVTVKQDEETIVDFSDYKVTEKNIGEVTFAIEPDGAELYLNGTAVNYSTPITLNYGKYNVTVALTGYQTYSGVLEVAQASKTIHIDLIEEEATASDTTAAPTSSPSGTDDSDSDDDSTVTKKIDSNHTITVSAPEGAEVYLDNVYKGMAPCTFTKVIGSQTITLSETGYVTKSYSVDILDDDKNAKYSFADLVKEEEEE